jgi:hypothetical protein
MLVSHHFVMYLMHAFRSNYTYTDNQTRPVNMPTYSILHEKVYEETRRHLVLCPDLVTRQHESIPETVSRCVKGSTK